MMTKNADKRVRRTKKVFQRTMLSLLKKKHFDEITITEIVKNAEFNRGTFYIHYEQKEDLLREIIDDVLSDLLTAFRHPYIKLEKEVNIVDLSITAIFDHFIDNKEIYQIMLGPNINEYFQEKMIKTMKKHFKEDIVFLSNDADDSIDLELFFTYRVHGIIGIIIEWINNDCHHSKHYMAEQVMKIATFHTKRVIIKIEE